MDRYAVLRPLAAVLVAAAIGMIAACAPIAVQQSRIDTSALAPALDGEIARLTLAAGLLPDQSSYRLTQSNSDALALRLRSAQLAVSSLDVAYYMWLDDDSGRLLAGELLRAADRGVRVRMLLDDQYARKLDAWMLALDAHPNLEVRLYNPFHTRGFLAGNLLEMLLSGFRSNHRMHNKVWIADGRFALVGGRNIGDEYFGLDESFDFRDLGVLTTGAAAVQASEGFDRYWASPIVAPLTAATGPGRAGAKLAQAQAALEAERASTLQTDPLQAALQAMPDLKLAIERGSGRYVGNAARVVTDPPDKWRQRSKQMLGVALDIAHLIAGAEHEVILISPYFVPGARGVRWLESLQARGVQVRVLTNSLDATDVPVVHAGYARYRHRLLRAGVQINELKSSRPERPGTSLHGSSRASLHTKAVVIDGRSAFVGSFNLDPRSTWINTEMGVVIDDPRFAALVRANFEQSLSPERSYHLSLEGYRLVWTDAQDGVPRRSFREPSASWSRSLIAFLARLLPFEEQL